MMQLFAYPIIKLINNAFALPFYLPSININRPLFVRSFTLLIFIIAFTLVSTANAFADEATTANDTVDNSLQLTPLTEKVSSNSLSIIEHNRQQAQQNIHTLLTSPPFYQDQAQTHYRWRQASTSTKTSQILGLFINATYPAFLYAMVFVIFFIGLSYYKLQRSKTPQTPSQRTLPTSPENTDDCLTTFETYWAQTPRHAINFLYNYLLNYLQDHYQLPITPISTEQDVLLLVEPLQLEPLTTLTQYLITQKQHINYGHQEPTSQQKEQLKHHWRTLFVQQDALP